MAFSWLLVMLVMMALDPFDIGNDDGHDEGVPSGGSH